MFRPIAFQEGGQLIEEAGSGGDLRVTAEMEGEAGMGRLPPLNTYSRTSWRLSGTQIGTFRVQMRFIPL